MEPFYDAFISYSHAADGRLAPALQRALHRFAKPWYRLRALHTFRDQTNLAVNPHLWDSIEDALAKSQFFLLLASPEAARSKWVGREVEFWLRERSPETLLIGLTAGDLCWDEQTSGFDAVRSNALPEPLLDAFRGEPLYVDLRWARDEDDLSLRNARFRQAAGRIAATLRGAEPDALFGEDVRQMRQARRTAWTGAGLLVIATVLAIWFAAKERLAAREAASNLAANYLQQARKELLGERPLRSLAYIESAYRAASFLPDVQYMLWRALGRIQSQRVVATKPQGLRAATFSARGDSILLIGSDDSLEVWDVASEENRFRTVVALTKHSFAGLSADGKWLAAGGFGVPLRLWDVASGALVLDTGQVGPVFSVAVSGEAERMAVLGHDHLLRLWDVPNQQVVKEIDFNVWDVAFSHDGHYIITGSGNGFIRIWDARDGTSVAGIEAGDDTQTERTIWGHVGFSARSRRAFAGGGAGHAVVLDVPDDPRQMRVTPLKMDESPDLSDSAFSADERYVAASSYDGMTRVWSCETGERLMAVQNSSSEDFSAGRVFFSPDSRLLLTLSAATGEIRVWGVPDGNLVASLDGPSDWALAGAFLPDGTGFVTADRDGSLRVWDLRPDGGEVQLQLPTEDGFKPLSAAFSADGRRIAVGSRASGEIGIFDTASGRLVRSLRLEGEVPGVLALAIDGGGTRVLGAGGTSLPKLWDLDSPDEGRQLQTHLSPEGIVFSVEMSGDGRMAATATAGEPTGVTVWSTETIDPVLRLPEVQAMSLALSPRNDALAMSGAGFVSLQRLLPGAPPLALELPPEDIFPLAFNDDGTRLAGGGSRGTSWLWDTALGDIILSLEGHTALVRELRWVAGGTRVVTASNDGTARVWNASTGALLDVVGRAGGSVIGVGESRERGVLLTFSERGWVQRWIQPGAQPDLREIDRLLDCHMPWAVVQGTLVPRVTHAENCP